MIGYTWTVALFVGCAFDGGTPPETSVPGPPPDPVGLEVSKYLSTRSGDEWARTLTRWLDQPPAERIRRARLLVSALESSRFVGLDNLGGDTVIISRRVRV